MLEYIVNVFSKLYHVLLLPHGVHARVDVDLALRTLFGFYYFPLVLYVILVGTNVALQFLYVSILPSLQELPLLNLVNNQSSSMSLLGRLENVDSHHQQQVFKISSLLPSFLFSSSASSDDQNANIIKLEKLIDLYIAHLYFYVSEVFTALLPHACFFFIIMAFMNKIVTASGEAMVDTMSYYRGMDYPLLYATVKVSILASWKRQILSFCVGSIVLGGVWLFASGFILNVISNRPASVIAAVWSNVVWCGLYLTLSFLSAFTDERRRLQKIAAAASEEEQSAEATTGETPTTTAANCVKPPAATTETSSTNSKNKKQSATTNTNNKNKKSSNNTSNNNSKKGGKHNTSSSSRNNNNNNNNHHHPVDGSDLEWIHKKLGLDTNSSSPASSLLSSPAFSPTFLLPSPSDIRATASSAFNPASETSPLHTSLQQHTSAPSWVHGWWRHHVNFIRHISISFLLVFFVFWCLTEGPINAFRFFVETLIALNIPNFCIYLTLKIVVNMIRAYYGFNWLLRHTDEGWVKVVILLSLPYLALMAYTASFVGSATAMTPVVALSWASVQIVSRCILLCREDDVSGHHIVWSTILHRHHHDQYNPTDSSSGGGDINHPNDQSSTSTTMTTTTSSKPVSKQNSKSPTPACGHSRTTSASMMMVSNDNNIMLDSSLGKNDSLYAKSNNSSSVQQGDHAQQKVIDEHHEKVTTKTTTSRVTTTKRRVAPAVAALLENAYECDAPTTTETISLEMEADLTEMKLYKRGLVMDLVREEFPSENENKQQHDNDGSHDDENDQNNNNNNTTGSDEQEGKRRRHRHVPVFATAVRLFPRLFLFQSSPSFSGAKYQIVKTLLRIIGGAILGVFILLVVCLVAQESMEILTPLPMKLNCLSGFDKKTGVCHDLELDHLVIKLRLTSRKPDEEENDNNNNNNKMSKPSHQSVENKLKREDAVSGGGPICDVEAVKAPAGQTNTNASVHLFELSWLSLLPYLGNYKNVTTTLDAINYALGTDWTILPFAEKECSLLSPPVKSKNNIENENRNSKQGEELFGLSRRPRQPWRAFMRLRSASRNVTTVVIRGTDLTSIFDMLQDVDMYLESFVYHLMGHLIPGLRLLPGQIVRDLIRLSSEAWPQDRIACIDKGCLRDDAVRSERKYYDIVLKFLNNDAESFAKKYPLDRVVLTGHSMAGAISHIVAARFPLAFRSFGFHSPGVELSSYKFGINSLELVRRKATTIIAENDIVPHIGGQIGTQIPLPCHDKVKERCHALEASLISYWKVCKKESLSDRFPKIKDVSLG